MSGSKGNFWPLSRRNRQLKVYSLPQGFFRRPVRSFLSLSVILYGSFFGGILNGALLVFSAGALLAAGWTGGSFTALFWILPQLLLFPLLMAGEEFLHLLVFHQKGLAREDLNLVVVYRIAAGGRRLICYGGAVRYKGALKPMDKIHISAPGPLLSFLGLVVLWSVISLRFGPFLGKQSYLQFLPITCYLLSSLWPFEAFLPSDLANILRARREGHYGLLQTLGGCVTSLRLIWASWKQLYRRR